MRTALRIVGIPPILATQRPRLPIHASEACLWGWEHTPVRTTAHVPLSSHRADVLNSRQFAIKAALSSGRSIADRMRFVRRKRNLVADRATRAD